MTTSLVSFDGTERCAAPLLEPADHAALRAVFADHPRVAIRGSGLSYCQAGAADGTPSISTRAFDQIIHLDEEAATVRVEAGTTIGALLRHVVAKGFWFPVLPGHPEISVGGCAAFNIHGKTQHDIGQFSDHVVGLTLLHPDHGEIVCDAEQDHDLLLLTLGGMGLTGWILDVTLQLEPLRAPMIRRTAHRAADFVDAVELMSERDAPGVHLYSWNDGNRRGHGFGTGVVYEEAFVDGDRPARSRYRTLRPEQRGRLLPIPLWNRLTTTVVNRGFGALEARRPARRLPALDAAFPINGKEGYFHAFGRRGLHEYQLIVPADRWPEAVERVRVMVHDAGACVTLASLKLFRGEHRDLWFRSDGICLTIDGPATARTRRLFAGLDDLAIDLGAPVNLAKDSRLSAAAVARIFPGYDDFRRRLREFDPARRFDSALRRRIDV